MHFGSCCRQNRSVNRPGRDDGAGHNDLDLPSHPVSRSQISVGAEPCDHCDVSLSYNRRDPSISIWPQISPKEYGDFRAPGSTAASHAASFLRSRRQSLGIAKTQHAALLGKPVGILFRSQEVTDVLPLLLPPRARKILKNYRVMNQFKGVGRRGESDFVASPLPPHMLDL